MNGFKLVAIRNTAVAGVVFVLVLAAALSISLGSTGHLGSPGGSNLTNSVTGSTNAGSTAIASTTAESTQSLQCMGNLLTTPQPLQLERGYSAGGLAYDSVDDRVFLTVSNGTGNWVLVLSAENMSAVIDRIPVGSNVTDIAFDSQNDDLYVVNSRSNSVWVINAATDTVLRNVSVGKSPLHAEYDPSNNDIYVSNSLSNSISVIDGASNTVASTILLDASPSQFAYDSSNGAMYVTAGTPASVYSIVQSDQIAGHVEIGINSNDLAYDAANGDLYVASSADGNISIVNPNSLSMIGTVILPYAINAISYFPPTSEIVAATNATGGLLFGIDTSNQFAESAAKAGLFVPVKFDYDSKNQDLIMSSLGNPLYTIASGCQNGVINTCQGIQLHPLSAAIGNEKVDNFSFAGAEAIIVNVTSQSLTDVNLSVRNVPQGSWAQFVPGMLKNVGPHGVSTTLLSAGTMNSTTPSNALQVNLDAFGSNGASGCAVEFLASNFQVAVLPVVSSMQIEDLGPIGINQSVTSISGVVYSPSSSVGNSPISVTLSVQGLVQENGSIIPLPTWLSMTLTNSSFTLNPYVPFYYGVTLRTQPNAQSGSYTVAVSEDIGGSNFTTYAQVIIS